MIDRATINEIKARHPLDALMARDGVKLGRVSAKGVRAGQCLCDPKRGKLPLWINVQTQTWGCLAAHSECGGDCFTYLEQQKGWDWQAAIRALVYEGAAIADPARAKALEAERQERIAANAQRNAALDLAEREKAFGIWRQGVSVPGTLVDAYFAHRGLAPIVSRALRFSPDEAYWMVPAADDAAPVVIHRGPCLLAAIQGPDGKFLGLHRTWLDPRLADGSCPPEASGKAVLAAPDGTPLPAKKMRGGKKGGAIRLFDHHPDGAGSAVLLCGEGIETVATVYQAALRRGTPGVTYYAWVAGDLGNLAGGGLGPSTPHPLRDRRWVPPREPDLAAPGLLPPAWADHAVLLGDGDSDPAVTGALLECAQARWIAAGVPTVIVMAEPGRDFNDMVRERAA